MATKKTTKAPRAPVSASEQKLDGTKRPICMKCGKPYEGKDADLCPECDRILAALIYAQAGGKQ